MQLRFTAILMMLVLVFCPRLMASGKAENKFIASFHMQSDENDNPKMIFPQLTNGKTLYFRRMPEVSTKDIVAFSPFPSDVGEGYGVVFQLKDNAAKRLMAITNFNQGRWMLAEVNGRAVDGVLIDKPVSDGMLVIWKGVTLEDITLFEKSLPRIGQEGKKK